MKKPFLPVIPVFLLLIGCVLSTPYPTPTPEPAPTSTAVPPTATSAVTPTTVPTATPETAVDALPVDWADLTLYQQAMLPAFAADVDRFVDATRYLIDLNIDVEALAFSGTAQVRYTNSEAEPLEEIVFRLLPNTPGYGGAMSVRSVTVNGVATDPRFEFEGSAVYVPLASPLAPGEMVELDLAFEGTIPTDVAEGYAQYGYFDRVLALPNAYPMIPVYDDEGWNVELAPTHGDATFADTSLYLVRITLSTDMILVTSGVTVDRLDNGDGTATYTCVSGPMRDFNLVASVDYEAVETTVGEVRIASYYLPGDKAGGKRALDYASRSLRIYEELIGLYPFTELDVIATPTEAGGIEYPGLIVVADWLYDRKGGFFELATVHEVAHQWWYSLVGNDQLDEPWLDEALTQYTSLLYYEHRYGQERAQKVVEDSFQGPYHYLLESEQDMAVGLPVAAYTDDLYGAVVYGKGPLFFHEMRQQVGDETFYEILRTYFDQCRYGVAYPSDFMAVAERVSGQELDALYQEWILGD